MKYRQLKAKIDLTKAKLFKYLFDAKERHPVSTFDWHKIKHLVINKADGKLGDCQIITQFIHNLQVQYPNLAISVITAEYVKPIFTQTLGLKQVWVVKKRPSLLQIRRTCRKINAIAPCSMLICTEEHMRPRDYFLLHELKPSLFVGFDRQCNAININLLVLNQGKQIADYFVSLLKIGGCLKIINGYQVIANRHESDHFKNLYQGNKVIGLAPWGAAKSRHLKDEVIIALAKKIIADGKFKLALLVPPSAALLKLKLAQAVTHENLITLPNSMSCNELSAAISELTAMISVDTGTLHLADAGNIPLLGIYSGTDTEGRLRWSPRTDNQTASIFFAQNKKIMELSYQEIEPAVDRLLTAL